jgi:Fe-S cluster assembly scaffold protein SufB
MLITRRLHRPRPLQLLLLVALFLLSSAVPAALAFVPVTAPPTPSSRRQSGATTTTTTTQLGVSIGLGPQKDEQQQQQQQAGKSELVAGKDYDVPDHESYRTSRRSLFDERCDRWFAQLLEAGESIEDGSEAPSPSSDSKVWEVRRERVQLGCLGDLAREALDALLAPVPLTNEVELDINDPDWTPYVSTKLPWTPLTPAYGLEAFGLPVPRRGAEAWRQFDVTGLVSQPYRAQMKLPECLKSLTSNEDAKDKQLYGMIRLELEAKGCWLDDDACRGRLVYVNGAFVQALSKVTEEVYNLQQCPDDDPELRRFLGRLTDGFSDELLAVDQPGVSETLQSRLSGPNHKVGPATSQFAINTQQGTACFAALNTIQVPNVAVVRSFSSDPLPVLVVQAFTQDAGLLGVAPGSDDVNAPSAVGNVRVLAVAEAGSRLSLQQSQVDLDLLEFDTSSKDDNRRHHLPKFVNGYTQLMVMESANVSYSILEQLGGMVTPNVEAGDDDESYEDGDAGPTLVGPSPRELEVDRPGLRDTVFNTVDAHVWRGGYISCTGVQMGGSGRDRLVASVSLLQGGSGATVSGFCLSGGAQRCEARTNVHHVAPDTTCRQVQKSLVGGRSTASFRGRIRVEQDAQRTDAQQLSRSILLTDKSRAWSVPSLEIIADDVKCSHGTTVSDLSEEELFYLTSRGLGRTMARKLLMYAFASDVCSSVDPAFQDPVREQALARLENLVPRGDRAVRGEFQSI